MPSGARWILNIMTCFLREREEGSRPAEGRKTALIRALKCSGGGCRRAGMGLSRLRSAILHADPAAFPARPRVFPGFPVCRRYPAASFRPRPARRERLHRGERRRPDGSEPERVKQDGQTCSQQTDNENKQNFHQKSLWLRRPPVRGDGTHSATFRHIRAAAPGGQAFSGGSRFPPET